MGKKKDCAEKSNEMRYRQMGLWIAFYRKLNGYTQEEFAERLNISAGYLSQVESQSKVQPISMDLLFDIADLLGIDPARLLEFKKDGE